MVFQSIFFLQMVLPKREQIKRGETMEKQNELKVIIKAQVVLDSDLKNIVKLAEDARKEYGCNCTLIINKI